MSGVVNAFAGCLLTMAPNPEPQALEPSAFLRACQGQEGELVAYFSKDDVWRPERKGELLLHLQVVGVVQPKSVMPTILRPLAYYDDRYEIQPKLPLPEQEYPVYGALKKYGASAIPELITYLKRTQEPDDKRQATIEAYLAARLLRDLSDAKEIGKAMARARIQAEFDQFPKADFPRLKAILARPILR